ncbi:MAG: YihA family ribosome biogenesis GTP-binding protein [Saprospiraceae bacterium]|nr:YihA family ribosome biogenesis GTP-binding protein [Saprospiraceae bacterium]
MVITEAKYIGSYPRLELCPKDERPEYAFIGRSNVGKSSLINMLCNRNELAHTSKKPGKTQMLNYYEINHSWYLVDLPGYGYAITSKKTRDKWRLMIDYFLRNRKTLLCAFVLIDVNVPPQQIDIEFINRLGENQVPYAIVYTKADRSKKEELMQNQLAFEKALLAHWDELPERFVTSANERIGREDVLDRITQINKDFFEYTKLKQ